MSDAQIRRELMAKGTVRCRNSRKPLPPVSPTFIYNPFRKGGVYGDRAKAVFHL